MLLSEGVPDEKSIMNDALLVYERVKKNFGEVDLLGYSLGCAVASYVASKKESKKLFLDTCTNISKTSADIYIFASRNDNVVPVKNARRLQNCSSLAAFLELDGLNHVEILCDEKVIDAIETYL